MGWGAWGHSCPEGDIRFYVVQSLLSVPIIANSSMSTPNDLVISRKRSNKVDSASAQILLV